MFPTVRLTAVPEAFARLSVPLVPCRPPNVAAVSEPKLRLAPLESLVSKLLPPKASGLANTMLPAEDLRGAAQRVRPGERERAAAGLEHVAAAADHALNGDVVGAGVDSGFGRVEVIGCVNISISRDVRLNGDVSLGVQSNRAAEPEGYR